MNEHGEMDPRSLVAARLRYLRAMGFGQVVVARGEGAPVVAPMEAPVMAASDAGRRAPRAGAPRPAFAEPAAAPGARVAEASAAGPSGPPPANRAGALKILRDEEIGACTRCGLAPTRKNIVFGVGSPDAKIVFVGEAPGRDEDLKGEPFVGRAGQLLDKMLAAIDLSRETVYIANVLKCRPPDNRDPSPEEIATCRPFLEKQIDILRPWFIVTMGNHATKTLLDTKVGITALRGKFREYRGTRLLPTYHPAFLLRNAAMKRPAWEDLQLLQREYLARRAQEGS